MNNQNPEGNSKNSRGLSRKIKVYRISNEIFTLLIFVLIVAFCYFLTTNFLNYRWDLTSAGHYSLSDTTLKLLERIKMENRKVKVTIFFRPANSSEQRLPRTRIYDLLEEYHLRSGKKILPVQVLDPNKNPGEVRRLGVNQEGTIALEFEEEGEPSKGSQSKRYLIKPFELWSVKEGTMMDQKVEFKGENALTSALKKLYEGKGRIAYFLEGHREAPMTDKGGRGIHQFIENLGYLNISTRSLNLVKNQKVPQNADLVVLFGPQQKLLPLEDQILSQYAQQGGRFLILADFDRALGLPKLMEYLGVRLGQNLVIETQNPRGGDPTAPIPAFGDHIIVRGLARSGEKIYLSTVQSVERGLGDTRGITTSNLLLTSNQSWAEVNFDDINQAKFNEGSGDIRGPITMGLAVFRSIPNPKIENKIFNDNRAVIFGDSDFARNEFIEYVSNVDLILNSVRWLVDEEGDIGISPKDPQYNLITMTNHQIMVIFFIVVLMLPGIVLCFGIVQWWHRRSL